MYDIQLNNLLTVKFIFTDIVVLKPYDTSNPKSEKPECKITTLISETEFPKLFFKN